MARQIDDKTKQFLRLLIDDKLTKKAIAEQLNYTESYIRQKIHRLKSKKYIVTDGKEYHFTNKGSELYRNPRGVNDMITHNDNKIEIHYHRIKAKVLSINMKNSTFLKQVETIIKIKNYQQGIDFDISKLINHDLYIFKNCLGTEIRCTTRSVLITIPKQSFPNIDSALNYSQDYFNMILPKIESFFQIKLDTKFINQFWLSNRHIEYVKHPLALLHKKYDCMDIEILDNQTNQRALYFDFSKGKDNPSAESDSTRIGIDVNYALQQLDRDIVDGYSMKNNANLITKNQSNLNNTNQTLDKASNLILRNTQTLDVFRQEIELHLESYRKMGTGMDALIKTLNLMNYKINTPIKNQTHLEIIKSNINSRTDHLNYPNLMKQLSYDELIELTEYINNNFE